MLLCYAELHKRRFSNRIKGLPIKIVYKGQEMIYGEAITRLVVLAAVAAASSGISMQETTIRTRAGGQALLPCDISEPRSQEGAESLQVILWFKDEASIPIYTVDARESGSFWGAIHGNPHRDSRISMTSLPSALLIQNVQRKDAGSYRCRVDFRQSPTRNVLIKLEIF